MLERYLASDFLQKLIHRQSEIDERLLSLIEQEKNNQIGGNRKIGKGPFFSKNKTCCDYII